MPFLALELLIAEPLSCTISTDIIDLCCTSQFWCFYLLMDLVYLTQGVTETIAQIIIVQILDMIIFVPAIWFMPLMPSFIDTISLMLILLDCTVLKFFLVPIDICISGGIQFKGATELYRATSFSLSSSWWSLIGG